MVPLYHTHYSSPAYVAFYLLRVFPELTIHIQSGRFDQSSRTFTSVEETWCNVCERATGDVKELIPQFYSDPSFLSNELGIAPSQDVVLPPWAHGSSEDFVRLMRAALESDYVSAHLHLWIDLVFGSKQIGGAALAADNLFHQHTYESALLSDDADDDAMELVRAYASEFGQTPPQLFTRAHPPRRLHVHRTMPWRAAEPAATLIQASARRWLSRRHIEENAVAFFFDHVVFNSVAAAPSSFEMPPIDLMQRTNGRLQLACSKRTADWMLGLISTEADSEHEIRSFLESCFRSDDEHAHHPSERHPFAQLLVEYCSVVRRVFDHKHRGLASRMGPSARLTALSVVVQLGVKHTHAIILRALPPLQEQNGPKVVHALVLDEITSRLFRSLIMPLVRDVHGADDAIHAETVAAFGALRPHHFGGVANLPRRFWLGSDTGTCEMPYAAAIQALAHLSATHSTRRKLELLVHVLQVTQQQVWSHHGVTSVDEQVLDEHAGLRLAADDLVSIMTYVISQSPSSLHLCSELASIEIFADEGSLIGEQGYCLATFQAALGCLRSLSWSEIEAASCRSAETSMKHSVMHGNADASGVAVEMAAPPPYKADEQHPGSPHRSGLEAVNASAPYRKSRLGERLARARLANRGRALPASQASTPQGVSQTESAGEEVQAVVSPPRPTPSRSRLGKRLARARVAVCGGQTTASTANAGTGSDTTEGVGIELEWV